MAVQTERPTHDGNAVEIIDSESHRSKEMREIRYLEGEHEGATQWVFKEDLDHE